MFGEFRRGQEEMKLLARNVVEAADREDGRNVRVGDLSHRLHV